MRHRQAAGEPPSAVAVWATNRYDLCHVMIVSVTVSAGHHRPSSTTLLSACCSAVGAGRGNERVVRVVESPGVRRARPGLHVRLPGHAGRPHGRQHADHRQHLRVSAGLLLFKCFVPQLVTEWQMCVVSETNPSLWLTTLCSVRSCKHRRSRARRSGVEELAATMFWQYLVSILTIPPWMALFLVISDRAAKGTL